MALSPEQLQMASDVVGAAPSLREAAALWRARCPDVRVILVDAIDMRDETPVLQLGTRRVYLSASNGHCWHVTTHAQEASALILAEA